MFKILITLCLIAAAVSSPAKNAKDDIKVNLLVVENIEEFKKAYAELELIPLKAEVTPLGILRHSAGRRVAGDRLVARGQDGQNWPTPRDVQLTLRYPTSGVGAIVSYIQVTVDQSSNIGEGYIIAGGIGQRFVTFVIQARSTSHFHYTAEIYGY
ncbi:uncharacterized protein LOC129612572 [Condylostylus longicornis]|uniref:uncharacterized protein LOC129612572 n=1 Tax=Condylostylus longicornis TaxID=2530218 RepID=UPI00244DE8C3|nr:uncharacterized protein LOC129612572 [Condylostylus longicornis]